MNSRERALRLGNTLSFSVLVDYLALTKPKLLFIVLMSTIIGYVLPYESTLEFILLNLLIGTAFTGAGAHALNHWKERISDGLMKRTQKRPLPTGKLESEEVLIFGIILSVIGVTHLWVTVNPLTSLLGCLTLLSYILVYTPLKYRTHLNTWIGAFTGALPPLMGWAAQQGTLDIECLPIFTILYFWQLPHFFAISWVYREDYKKGGFQMLSLYDEKGEKTALQMMINGILLFVSSISLYFFDQGGTLYLTAAFLCGTGFMLSIVRFMNHRTEEKAKNVFKASIVYLPVLCLMMVMDRLLYY